MRDPRFLAAAACAALALLSCPPALAQDLPGGARLGMSIAQLRAAAPAVRAVPRPARLAGGLVGGWTSAPVAIGGVLLAPTFFFARGELRRVEYRAADPHAGAFEALRAWGRRHWGAELATRDPDAACASWASDGTDVYLQQTHGRQGEQLRLVIKPRVVKEADEL